MTMRRALEHLPGEVAKHDGNGLEALKSLARHFEWILLTYESISNRTPPPLETAPGVRRELTGSITYDAPQQGFAGIDAIPRLLFNQPPTRDATNMDQDGAGSPSKRGSDGSVATGQAAPDEADSGWTIFKQGTPQWRSTDGQLAEPPRYQLNLDYKDCPSGSREFLNEFIEKARGRHKVSTVPRPLLMSPPQKCAKNRMKCPRAQR